MITIDKLLHQIPKMRAEGTFFPYEAQLFAFKLKVRPRKVRRRARG